MLAIIEERNFIDELANDPRLVSEHTRRGYAADLRHFDSWREGRPLSKLLVERYAAEMQAEGMAPSSINRRLSAVRWWARRTADLVLDMPARNVTERRQRAEIASHAERVASVPSVKGARTRTGRYITQGELSALMQSCDDGTRAGIRDAAIIALMWSTGLRRFEVANLDYGDVSVTGEDEADINIRSGKGGKSRTLYLFNGGFLAMEAWLDARGRGDGPLFTAINKGGVVYPDRLSPGAVGDVINKRSEMAKIPTTTSHDLRRSFVSQLLDAGIDIVQIQHLCGHSSPATTSRYDRRPAESRKRAVKVLFVPYFSKN